MRLISAIFLPVSAIFTVAGLAIIREGFRNGDLVMIGFGVIIGWVAGILSLLLLATLIFGIEGEEFRR